MKLTWSEASIFAFVWACALGYIVASRILEWNFERFLPSNWYFVVKKRLAQPEAKFLRTEKVPKKISNVLEELLTLMQTGNLQKSTVRMDRTFQKKVMHEVKLLEGRGLSRQLHFTNVKLSEGNAKKRDFRHWSDSGREWREVIVEAAVSDKYLHRDSGKVIHESIYPHGSILLRQSRHIRHNEALYKTLLTPELLSYSVNNIKLKGVENTSDKTTISVEAMLKQTFLQNNKHIVTKSEKHNWKLCRSRYPNRIKSKGQAVVMEKECPSCGANYIPDNNGCCSYCGYSLQVDNAKWKLL